MKDPGRSSWPCETYKDFFATPQWVYDGGWHLTAVDIVSRDPYDYVSEACFQIPLVTDMTARHMRVFDLVPNPSDGYWSVGTAHFDGRLHGWGSINFDETRDEVRQSFIDGEGDERWFVQDIWELYVGNDDPLGCLMLPWEDQCLTPPDGMVVYIQTNA